MRLAHILLVVIVLASYGLGWVVAHAVVATECNKLGAFYVGSTVFQCSAEDGK